MLVLNYLHFFAWARADAATVFVRGLDLLSLSTLLAIEAVGFVVVLHDFEHAIVFHLLSDCRTNYGRTGTGGVEAFSSNSSLRILHLEQRGTMYQDRPDGPALITCAPTSAACEQPYAAHCGVRDRLR